jgi:hypothetical protein
VISGTSMSSNRVTATLFDVHRYWHSKHHNLLERINTVGVLYWLRHHLNRRHRRDNQHKQGPNLAHRCTSGCRPSVSETEFSQFERTIVTSNSGLDRTAPRKVAGRWLEKLLSENRV